MSTETDMIAKPQVEHHWLEKLVGDWTYEGEGFMGDDQPPMKSSGTESVRSLSGLWYVCEGSTKMLSGEPATTIMTLGYDPQQKKYRGTWIGSMMTHLWVYSGELDDAKKILTLNSEGPSFTQPGQMAQYQDIIEIVSDDKRILRSQYLGEDGKWHHFMTANYQRKR